MTYIFRSPLCALLHCDMQTSISEGTDNLLTSLASDMENSCFHIMREQSLGGIVLSEAVDRHKPLKTEWFTIRPDAPWFDDRILSPVRAGAGQSEDGDFPD